MLLYAPVDVTAYLVSEVVSNFTSFAIMMFMGWFILFWFGLVFWFVFFVWFLGVFCLGNFFFFAFLYF